jgi:hypothetical protein
LSFFGAAGLAPGSNFRPAKGQLRVHSFQNGFPCPLTQKVKIVFFAVPGESDSGNPTGEKEQPGDSSVGEWGTRVKFRRNDRIRRLR